VERFDTSRCVETYAEAYELAVTHRAARLRRQARMPGPASRSR
jgi:hypothetical protein